MFRSKGTITLKLTRHSITNENDEDYCDFIADEQVPDEEDDHGDNVGNQQTLDIFCNDDEVLEEETFEAEIPMQVTKEEQREKIVKEEKK